MAAEPSVRESAAVDALLGSPETGWDGGERTAADLRVVRGRGDERTMLLPALHALQGAVGWVSEGGLTYVCERLGVPPAEAYGVATFYAMFSTRPRPPSVVHVCDDLACRVGGAKELCEALGSRVGPEGQPTDAATWVRSPCLGMCDQAPVMFAQRVGRPDVTLGEATAETFYAMTRPDSTVVCSGGAGAPQTWDERRGGLRLLTRVGAVDPTSLEDFRAHGGYEALAKALEMGSDAVIKAVSEARLLGRGGAAFPTGFKWRAVADQPSGPKYVVCNADESEPGTFKDRVVMENDPFSVIESLTIAGLVCGAERGFIYVRGEYPLATERLEHAIAEARAAALLGSEVMGSVKV